MRIASGADHLILLDIEGNVWSMGCAESGQLGRVNWNDKLHVTSENFRFHRTSARRAAEEALAKF